MPCSRCGGALELLDSTSAGAIDEFVERYACVDCRAQGAIFGDPENMPDSWTYYGEVFGK